MEIGPIQRTQESKTMALVVHATKKLKSPKFWNKHTLKSYDMYLLTKFQ